MKNSKIFKKGFTLIETLVAITILIISVTGPLSLASKGLSYSNYAKEEITAFYLANEALEVVRNIRDSNIRSGKNWLKLPPDNGTDTLVSKCGGGCYFDVWKNPVEVRQNFTSFGDNVASGELLKICTDGNKNYYGYSFDNVGVASCSVSPDNLPASNFTRKIFVKTVGTSGKEVSVNIIVSWPERNGQTKKVTISENMFELLSI